MSNKPPIEVPQGAIRLNTDSQKLEFYAQDRWHEMATESASGLGNRAFRAGGGSGGNTIEYWNIATGGTGVDSGFDLSTGVHSHACAGSRTRAVQAGGRSSAGAPWAQQNVIQYFEMTSLSNSIDFGDLTSAVGRHDAHSNQTRMITGGGQASNDLMNFITISSTGNATDFGNLSVGRSGTSAAGSPTRAIWGGGETSPSSSNVIDYVTIATTGNALDFGDLTNNRYFCAAMCNNVRAAWAQGYNIPAAAQNTIDYVTIATTGNATDFGDAEQQKWGAGKFSSPTRCGFFGGYSPTSYINQIDINVRSDSTKFGDLAVVGDYNGGHSDCHGGL